MAYLIDTNVISELRRKEKADPKVAAWKRRVADEEIFISVLIIGELRKGVERKRDKDPGVARIFEKWLNEVEAVFENQMLGITREIADLWGRMSAKVDLSPADGLIAATAAYHGLTVVTRNVRDFQRCGVDYVNPFED